MFEQLAEYEPFLCPNGVEFAHWATGDFRVTVPKDFSDVTLEATGLLLDRPAFFESIGYASSAPIPNAWERIEGAALERWIAHCPTENSKTAWQLLQAEFGKAAPKRDETFLPAWRKVKGQRRRGRLKNPPT